MCFPSSFLPIIIPVIRKSFFIDDEKVFENRIFLVEKTFYSFWSDFELSTLNLRFISYQALFGI